MKNENKIAILTEDGFTISQNFTSNSECLVFTIVSGKIIKQEMCDIQNLDCDKLFVGEIQYELEKRHEIIKTNEKLIVNLIERYLRSKSDTTTNP